MTWFENPPNVVRKGGIRPAMLLALGGLFELPQRQDSDKHARQAAN